MTSQNEIKVSTFIRLHAAVFVIRVEAIILEGHAHSNIAIQNGTHFSRVGRNMFEDSLLAVFNLLFG